jgi:17beta-estradiol 17-dehydrogenase / very-long-chain 3-oxoacyl-CoA reductase
MENVLPDSYNEYCLYIGLIYIAWKVISLFFSFLRVLGRCYAPDLIEKYGKGSWAVITGGSDGIGRGFAEQLAKRGFNLVLIARNKAKLEQVANEINVLNPEIKIKIVVADFHYAANLTFFDDIHNQIKDLDVSILVNNVGIDIIKPFEEISEEYLRNLLTINTFPIVLLTKKLINHFISRPKKSAIINLSSASAVIEMPYVTTYSSTKSFDHHFTLSLEIEYPQLDILSVRPGYVSTAMTDRKEISFDTISSNDCAEGSLRELGRYSHTFGHVKHEFIGWVLGMIPKIIRDPLVKHIFMQKEMDRRKQAKAESLSQQSGTKTNNGIYVPLVEA